jgi:hypothetical protein
MRYGIEVNLAGPFHMNKDFAPELKVSKRPSCATCRDVVWWLGRNGSPTTTVVAPELPKSTKRRIPFSRCC